MNTKEIFTIFALITLMGNCVKIYQFEDFQVEYEIFKDQKNITKGISNEIQITLTANHTGWISIGFGTIIKLKDLIVGFYDKDSKPQVQDYSAQGCNKPVLDNIQNIFIQDEKCKRSNNQTTIVFTRKLQTGDYLQDVDIQLNQFNSIFLAWGENDEFNKYKNYRQEEIFITDLNEEESVKQQIRLLQTCTNGQVVIDGVCKTNDLTIPTSSLILEQGQTFYWQFLGDGTIDFMVEYDYKGWFSIGFGENMDNVDMFVIQLISNNQVEILDLWSVSEDRPDDDAIQDYKLKGYQITDQGVKVKFNRKANTGDSKQDKALEKDGTYTFCAAYTSNNKMEDHEDNCYSFDITMSDNVHGQANIKRKQGIVTLHKIVLFWGWGILAEIGIIFGRYLKSYSFYITVHLIIFIILDFFTIGVVSAIINNNQEKLKEPDELQPKIYTHFIIGVIVLSLVILQHIVGIVLKHNIEKKTLSKNIPKIRLFHQINGFILYALTKVLLINGKYVEEDKEIGQGIAITVILIIIRIIVDIIYQIQPKFLISQRQQNSSKDQLQLISLLNSGASHEEIIKTIPTIKYCIINNNVYDISKIIHPGGQFILEVINGRDIGCYFYGGYALETSGFKPHDHSPYSYGLIEKNYIGTIHNEQLQGKNQLIISKQQSKLWNVQSSKKLTNMTNQFEFESQDKEVSNCNPGVEWIGQHYSVYCNALKKKRIYTNVTCMNETNCIVRQQLIQYYNNNCQGSIEFNLLKNNAKTLTLIIKNYNVPKGLSNYLSQNYQLKEQFEIDGPHGRGLELSKQSQGTYVIFTGGTGILPFMDLFDFLLKSMIYQVAAKKKGDGEAKSVLDPLDLGFGQYLMQTKFIVYAAFADESEFLGKDIIQTLSQICSENKFNNFQFSIRFSKQSTNEFKFIKSITQRYDRQFIESESKNWGSIDRAYICGPPGMNRDIPEALSICKPEVKIILV